jgi:hypothetical protein
LTDAYRLRDAISLLASIAVHVGVIERRAFGAVRCFHHRIGLRPRDAVVLRMLLAASSLADYRRRVAALALAIISCANITDSSTVPSGRSAHQNRPSASSE